MNRKQTKKSENSIKQVDEMTANNITTLENSKLFQEESVVIIESTNLNEIIEEWIFLAEVYTNKNFSEQLTKIFKNTTIPLHKRLKMAQKFIIKNR